MKFIQPFYGKKMLIVDLIIVTAWALAIYRDFSNLSTEYLLLLTSFVTIRIALSFEMQRKSPWTLFSALTFALCYITHFLNYGYLMYPYNLILIWILGIPIITGILQNNSNRIVWNKKGLWITMLILVSSAFWLDANTWWNNGDKELFFENLPWLIITTAPAFYWIFYQCKGRSPLQLLLSYKPLMIYIILLCLLSIYLLIGQQDIKSYKIILLPTMPLIVYILLYRWMNITPIPTRYAVMLSLAGLSYWFTITTPQGFKITAMITGIILSVYVAVEMTLRKHSLWAGISLFLVITIGSPVILGFNPYILTEADYMTQFYSDTISYKSDNGIFITVKHNRIGLRDRYGKILDDLFDRIDSYGHYISTQQGAFTSIVNNNYGLYDMQKHRFILNPDSIKITEMIPIADNEFKLMDGNRNHFATLYLPGIHYSLRDSISVSYLIEELPILPVDDCSKVLK